MTTSPEKTVVLLVEDNPGDAEYVTELLSQPSREMYRLVHAPRLSEAVERLRSTEIDVVLFDLHLPDSSGVDGLKVLREAAGRIPIVVLTAMNDEPLALACIDAGAQDYLAKEGVSASDLRRAIGYAITRIREAQVRELQESLERYRALSSATQTTTVTAALAGSGAVSVRSQGVFSAVVDAYCGLLQPFLTGRTDRIIAPRPKMEHLITMLGDVGGGPRDLLDVHIAAFDRTLGPDGAAQPGSFVQEARLLALEMMGLLVDYYRVGHRRRLTAGAKS